MAKKKSEPPKKKSQATEKVQPEKRYRNLKTDYKKNDIEKPSSTLSYLIRGLAQGTFSKLTEDDKLAIDGFKKHLRERSRKTREQQTNDPWSELQEQGWDIEPLTSLNLNLRVETCIAKKTIRRKDGTTTQRAYLHMTLKAGDKDIKNLEFHINTRDTEPISDEDRREFNQHWPYAYTMKGILQKVIYWPEIYAREREESASIYLHEFLGDALTRTIKDVMNEALIYEVIDHEQFKELLKARAAETAQRLISYFGEYDGIDLVDYYYYYYKFTRDVWKEVIKIYKDAIMPFNKRNIEQWKDKAREQVKDPR